MDTKMRARTHARAQKLPAPTRKRNCFFDANLEKMPCRIRKRPQRPKSSFEHKPWRLQKGVKVMIILHF